MSARALTRAALGVLAALTGLLLLLPVIIIMPMSFSDSSFLQFPPDEWSLRWFRNFFDTPTWTSSAWTSLRIAILTTISSVILGTLAALGLVRGRFPVRPAITALILAPVIVPYVIVGLAVYAVFLQLGLTQTTLGFVLVHTALAVPYVAINVAAALYGFDRRLELAAMSLGAGPVSTFGRITLPLIAPSMLAGALFAFVISWDEVVTSIFLSGSRTTTLPVRMWSGVRVSVDPTVAAISSMLLLVTISLFIVTALMMLIRRRRASASERPGENP